jgi:acetylornithine deacetylase
MKRTRIPPRDDFSNSSFSEPPDTPLEMTRALVSVPSVNPDLGGAPEEVGEARAARLCAGWLEAWGLSPRTLESAPDRTGVVAEIPGAREGPTLLLNGHLDTVGVEGMTVDPFDPVVRDGRLYGRGSCDMKSGVAAILYTARELASERDFSGKLVVALTPDEEYASIGMLDLLDGGLTADAAVVTEPTSLAIMPANKGFLVIRVLVRGVAAHGSRPDLGKDAIRGAGRILAAMDLFEEMASEEAPHPLLGGASIHAGTIRGGTAVSVYPDRCELTLEIRTLPGEEARDGMDRFQAVLARAREADPELDVEVEEVLFRPGSHLDPEHPLMHAFSRALEEEGEAVRVEGMSAWVESALLNEAGIPAFCFGPGAIEKAHTADEFVPVDEVDRAARVLHRFARNFLGGGAP